jgi:hypothetical protein
MIFHLPTHITKGKRKLKTVPINLNWYRNAHRGESNEVKKLYKALLAEQIAKCDNLPEPCMIAYLFYPGSRRKIDLGNVIAITDKFFLDALVESGKLSDDNCKVIPCYKAEFMAVDKENPRIEAHIMPYGVF